MDSRVAGRFTFSQRGEAMAQLTPRLRRSRDERGSTATEYGLLVLFIALAILLGVTAFGSAVNGMYTGLATWLNSR